MEIKAAGKIISFVCRGFPVKNCVLYSEISLPAMDGAEPSGLLDWTEGLHKIVVQVWLLLWKKSRFRHKTLCLIWPLLQVTYQLVAGLQGHR